MTENEQVARDHLKRAFSQPDFGQEDHLTAALVYAVLALNETLTEVGKTIGHPAFHASGRS